ncbi:unnamed protein product, partial [Amoebophrya sp. A120]|eukprot:GSA120T00008886001.1
MIAEDYGNPPAAFLCSNEFSSHVEGDNGNGQRTSSGAGGAGDDEKTLCEYPVLAVVQNADDNASTILSYNYKPAYYAAATQSP